MIQEVPYGTYIEMQTYSNDLNQSNQSNQSNQLNQSNDLNDLPISIVIIPNQTHKVIEKAIVQNRFVSCKCQIIIIIILTSPITLLLISIIIPITIH